MVSIPSRKGTRNESTARGQSIAALDDELPSLFAPFLVLETERSRCPTNSKIVT